MDSPAPRTLADLPRNASARIAQVTGNDTVSRRLREMGLLAGQTVRRAGAAPLGDPAIYFVRGFRLALRRAEASLILLEPAPIDEPASDQASRVAAERVERATT